jgi:hypothetical protein
MTLIHKVRVSLPTCPHSLHAIYALQPTATRCAFTFIMAKTVSELFSRAPGRPRLSLFWLDH